MYNVLNSSKPLQRPSPLAFSDSSNSHIEKKNQPTNGSKILLKKLFIYAALVFFGVIMLSNFLDKEVLETRAA